MWASWDPQKLRKETEHFIFSGYGQVTLLALEAWQSEEALEISFPFVVPYLTQVWVY
jgi:hypothetical protein